jgi:hypothetical protein
MRRSCRSKKGVHFNVHDLTLLSVLLTLPAAGGRMRPETARIQELRFGLWSSAAAASDTVLVDANREDRTLCIRSRSRYRDPSRPRIESHRERL